MSLLESLLYAVLGALTSSFPLGQAVHFDLVPRLLPLSMAGETQLLATKIGILSALLIVLRHDLASLLSALLGMLVYRKKPATLDEHVPLFLALLVIPYFVTAPHLRRAMGGWDWSLAHAALLASLLGAVLWFLEGWSRKSKSMADLGWLDCALIGALGVLAAIPGIDFLTLMICAFLLRNQRPESAVKASYLALTIIATVELVQAWPSFTLVGSAGEISTINFVLMAVIATLVSALACFSFMAKPGSFRLIGAYRFIVLGGASAWLWFNH